MSISALADFLRKARRDSQKTQSEIAESVKVTVQRISQWESGKDNPPTKKIHIVAMAYGVNERELEQLLRAQRESSREDEIHEKNDVAGSVGVEGRIETPNVSQALLRRLVRDVTFLSTPQTEEITALSLGVDRWMLREAVNGFERSGWLKRSAEGISRDHLDLQALMELFALRLIIERKAFQWMKNLKSDARIAVAFSLDQIINAQVELHEEIGEDKEAQSDGLSEKEKDADKRIDWFFRSVDFHLKIVEKSGLKEHRQHLEQILWRIRIGAGIPLETWQVRNHAVGEHHKLISDIRKKSWKESELILEHIREPLQRAATQIGAFQERAKSEEFDEVWKAIVDFYAPTAQAE